MKRYCPTCFSQYEQDLERCPEDNEKLVLVSDGDLVGTTLDERYKILSKVGEGGMGTVYSAEQAIIGRTVALKVLRGAMVQDQSSVKRFLTEAKAIAALKDSHTITLLDFGVTQEGQLYYTMEMLEGAPLAKVIKNEAPMDYARSARLMLQACHSLEEAHDMDILHRDIKPDNLYITHEKQGEHVTVLDFGIAKLSEDPTLGTITKTGMICGTPAYMSPEQAQGYAAVPASDLYALAIVYYEMLAGEPPFSDTTAMRILLRHITDTPAPVAVKNPDVEVPVSIESFFLRALAKKPEDRFQRVRDFRDALKTALEEANVSPDTTSMPSLGTSAQGLRVITAPMGDLGEEGKRIDPMAHTMDSSQVLRAVDKPTESADDPLESGPGASTVIQKGPPSGRPRVEAAPPPAPEPGTAAILSEVRSRRLGRAIWFGVLPVVLVAVALGLWRPWETEPDSAAGGPPGPKVEADAPPSLLSEPAPINTGSSSNNPGVAPDVTASPTVAAAAPPAPDVVDTTSAPELMVATAPPASEDVSDMVVPPDLVLAAAPTPDVVDTTQAPDIVVAIAPPVLADVADTVIPPGRGLAPPPTPDTDTGPETAGTTDGATAHASAEQPADAEAEAAARRADERRARRLAEHRAAKKAAARRAAKKAEEEAAAKKAAEAAAAKKAEEEAAAKKAAEAAAAKKATGLGFVKVTVEDIQHDDAKPGDKKGDGPGGGKVDEKDK